MWQFRTQGLIHESSCATPVQRLKLFHFVKLFFFLKLFFIEWNLISLRTTDLTGATGGAEIIAATTGG